MNALDSVVIALQFRGAQPHRIGPAQWRADCAACGERDALVGVGLDGLSIAARCGCARGEILQALSVEEVDR